MQSNDLNQILDLGHGASPKFYISFAGGGAKGMVHVGALKYLEDKGIKPSGVSGTSAGALIATLHAIGYSADDILNEHGHSKLFRDICATDYSQANGLGSIKGVDELFNKRFFNIAREVRDKPNFAHAIKKIFHSSNYSYLVAGAAILSAGLAVSISYLFAATVTASGGGFIASLLWGWFFFLLNCSMVGLRLFPFAVGMANRAADRVSFGLTDMEVFKGIFREIISRKVFGSPGHDVKFSDIDNLSIVATDIITGTPVIFSSSSNNGDSVANALCASMAIPGLFALQEHKKYSLYDGGVISNLPAWVFDAETRLTAGAKVVAINISSGVEQREQSITKFKSSIGLAKLFSTLPLLYGAITGGSQRVSLRKGSGVRVINVETSLRISDFDATLEDRKAAVQAGLAAVERLYEVSTIAPAVYSYLCSLIRESVAIELRKLYASYGRDRKIRRSKLRVSVATRAFDRRDIIHLKFSAGFYYRSKQKNMWIPHSDLGLFLPADRSVAGRAIARGESVFEILTNNAHGFLSDMEDYEVIRRVNESIKWVVAVPIAGMIDEEGERINAISIDSSDYLLDLLEGQSDEQKKKIVGDFLTKLDDVVALNLSAIETTLNGIPSMEDGIPWMEECDDAHRI